MNKDLKKKGRKIINKRNRKGQGYFYNCHSYNFKNRSNSSQANAISYSEYVLLNPNTKSCILRPNFNRTKSGYLKNISSLSIRKEKDQFGMGCYEEDTLRKIQNTSDMIKQQLMSSEHHPSNPTENETNSQSFNTPLKLKSKPNQVGNETSENTDHLLVKLKRKLSKSGEELSRLQLKEKRKNALRQKFKREITTKPKSLDSYDVKAISDKIIQHISKMNNDRLVDFLNSDNPRYEEAFSYISKQKSFELTKALRDLSMQKKPEACEIVNSIIPDFSLKIEELPIDIIRELSSTFDEMHKNIGDSCLSDEILNLFNRTGDLPKNDLLFSEEIFDGNLKNGNSFNKNDACINTENGTSQETDREHELIDVLDSDEEIPLLQQKNETSTTLTSCQEFDKIGIGINHHEMMNMISASNQDGSSNDLIDTHSIQHGKNGLIESTSPVNIENLQSLRSISSEIGSVHGESSIKTNTIIHPQDDDAHKTKDSAESLFSLNSVDLNSKPKIGSVWVSKNIFSTSNKLGAGEDPEIIVSNESHVRSSVSLENENTALNNSSYNKHYEPSSAVQKKICLNINKSSSPTELQEKESDRSYVSNSENYELKNFRSEDDSLTEIVPLISTGSDNLQLIEEVDNANCSSDCRNLETNSREKRQTLSKKLKESPNIPTSAKHLEKTPKKNVSTNDPQNLSKNQETSLSNEKSNTENEFISLIIKSFDKPDNLADAIKYMKVIDEKIEILNKLRQDIFITLSENTIISNRKKRKLETSEAREKNVEISEKQVELCKEKIEISEKNAGISKTNGEKPEANGEISRTSGDISNKSKSQDKKKDSAKMQQFLSLKSMNVVVLFFKIMYDRGECIVGTDKGKIQYHSVNGTKPLMTVTIGNSAISFLECVWIYDTNYVCTGVTSDMGLKFLQYKRRYIEQKIHLEDSIQALRTEWGFFFIGGKRGYLTRYDLKKDKIQYQDRISPSGIKDLRATKEGPRKILVILFEDPDGEAHVDVRDAMTALHIRTIIDIKNVRCMHLRYSSVYLVRDGEIKIYNCCDGNYIKTIKTWKSFSLVVSKGNLLLLGCIDGIYALNMKTCEFLGCFQPQISVASLIFYEKKIICSTWKNGIKLYDVPDRFRQIYEIK